tara:strand:- start:1207 stop:1620 length:414 start_codon:yes stop_codon:yes gene_type:complete
MRKDIKIPVVENIAVAVVEELNEEKTHNIYNVYFINLTDDIVENVLVTSKGYGENKTTGEQIKTSLLRHNLGLLIPNQFMKIEPIMEDVFGINNEYWVSFFIQNQMMDKKFVFLAETIQKSNFTTIPIINKKGVLIK